ncbi:hypothetical protein CoNPh17_CDS0144 [Staphylococcus phage S-CoN_Ph17]|nr:hypothetical protein CoNPh17_CDS0144 [Staphylococcus phage S-CoN_Ph17]
MEKKCLQCTIINELFGNNIFYIAFMIYLF